MSKFIEWWDKHTSGLPHTTSYFIAKGSSMDSWNAALVTLENIIKINRPHSCSNCYLSDEEEEKIKIEDRVRESIIKLINEFKEKNNE